MPGAQRSSPASHHGPAPRVGYGWVALIFSAGQIQPDVAVVLLPALTAVLVARARPAGQFLGLAAAVVGAVFGSFSMSVAASKGQLSLGGLALASVSIITLVVLLVGWRRLS